MQGIEFQFDDYMRRYKSSFGITARREKGKNKRITA
jgi:hypothetical protein